MDAGTISPVAVLRDARKSALLRTRLIGDIDVIRTSKTLYEPLRFDIEIKKIELEKRKGRREAGPLYRCKRRAEARARFRIELAPVLKEGRR
jgi:hypothetical protein